MIELKSTGSSLRCREAFTEFRYCSSEIVKPIQMHDITYVKNAIHVLWTKLSFRKRYHTTYVLYSLKARKRITSPSHTGQYLCTLIMNVTSMSCRACGSCIWKSAGKLSVVITDSIIKIDTRAIWESHTCSIGIPTTTAEIWKFQLASATRVIETAVFLPHQSRIGVLNTLIQIQGRVHIFSARTYAHC